MKDLRIKILLDESIARRGAAAADKVSRSLLAGIDEKIKEYSDVKTEGKNSALYDDVTAYILRLGDPRFLRKNGTIREARFYSYAYIDKSTWSEMKWGLVATSKKTILKLIIALKLDEDEAVRLLRKGRSGFDQSDPQDQVVLAMIDVRKAGFDITVDDAVEILDYYSLNGKRSFVSIYEIPGSSARKKDSRI